MYKLDKYNGIFPKIAGHYYDSCRVSRECPDPSEFSVEQLAALERCFSATASARHEGRFDDEGVMEKIDPMGFITIAISDICLSVFPTTRLKQS